MSFDNDLFKKLNDDYFFISNPYSLDCKINHINVDSYFEKDGFYMIDDIIEFIYDKLNDGDYTIYNKLYTDENIFKFFVLIFKIEFEDIFDKRICELSNYYLIFEIISDCHVFTSGDREQLSKLFFKTTTSDRFINNITYQFKIIKIKN